MNSSWPEVFVENARIEVRRVGFSVSTLLCLVLARRGGESAVEFDEDSSNKSAIGFQKSMVMKRLNWSASILAAMVGLMGCSSEASTRDATSSGTGGAAGQGGTSEQGGNGGIGGAGGQAGSGGNGGIGGAGGEAGSGGMGGNGGCVSFSEVCDGLDNDCNGTPDDGNPGSNVECNSGLPGVCNAGLTTCSSGAIQCIPNIMPNAQMETCNALDDDCNGQTDEGFNLGAACSNGVGTCAAAGVIACNAIGTATCNAVPGMPGAEVCDGLDNDCNGQIDNGYPVGTTCTVGLGQCAATGLNVCSGNGGVVCNASPNGGSTEVCGNQIDEDCDGVLDNSTCFESDASGNYQASGPYDAKKICRAGGGFDFYLCNPALGCTDYPAGCFYGGFHP